MKCQKIIIILILALEISEARDNVFSSSFHRSSGDLEATSHGALVEPLRGLMAEEITEKRDDDEDYEEDEEHKETIAQVRALQ